MNKAVDTIAVSQPDTRTGKLKVFEIFYSLQGESSSAGWPTVFIRLTGCPLRCTYCDTEYAFHGGQWMHENDILAETERHNTRFVCVTGGEPLAQKRCHGLLTRLCDAGYNVSLETSGAVDTASVDERVRVILDLKTPDSGEDKRNLWSNIDQLKGRDEVKFVIGSRADYDWSVAKVSEFALTRRCDVLFSPSYEILPPAELAQWILEDRLHVRFQTQLHKALWGEEPGR